jgi:hypothetical protein
MNHKEAKLQIELCKWLQDHGYYFFSVANEAHGRSAVQQMQLVSMGLRAGAADLVVVLLGRVVFVEIKAEDGKQSDAQKRFQARVESLGHQYVIVKSPEKMSCIFSDNNL